MEIALPAIAAPTVRSDSAVLFSAYGFGWGYCAFEIPLSIMCVQLGAPDATPKQLLLAFELGKRTIVQAIAEKNLPATGERVTLGSQDF